MVVTRTWLNDWIDLKDITTSDICKTLNSIGLEVDGVKEVRMPQNTVVGYVKTKKPHPDAKRLSVCEVDVGSEVLNIVCGASNVAQDQWVPVALSGAVLPNGMKIKPTNLRGVESNGMICSSTELGMPKINDGIMPLDASLGTLECGKPLSELYGLEDDIIEIGLTPNRGDCLSIRGVARDLSVVYKRPLIEHTKEVEEENLLGIGRILSLHVEDKIQSSFVYKAFEQDAISDNVLMELRLAWVEASFNGPIERLMEYVTYSTGVLMRSYDYECFTKEDEKAVVKLKKDSTGLDGVYGIDKRLSYVGFSQEPVCRADKNSSIVIVEASFIEPEIIASLASKNKNLKSDRHLYRSSRGSETELSLGMEYLWELLSDQKGVKLYAGSQKFIQERSPRVIALDMDDLSAMVGQEIPKNQVVDILKRLGFEVSIKGEQEVMHVSVPFFRHDVVGVQDVCEEVVRLVGIDNIASKPMVFAEYSRANKTLQRYKHYNKLRQRAASVGFFESIHYLFDSKEKQEAYGIHGIYKKRELSNPISSDLNTLRSTLVLHLLNSASNNIKHGRKSVLLFELGKVFDRTRDEKTKLGLVVSGEIETPCVKNHGKPPVVDFISFATKVEHIIGPMRLEAALPKDKITNPHEYAKVFVRDIEVGYIARVHAAVEKEFDLPRTYVGQIDVDALMQDRICAKPYSKFPSSSRDLSLLVPKDMSYYTLRSTIESASFPNLSRFYPIDRFESESFGDKVSLTLTFLFQHPDRTLEDKEVQESIDLIQEHLQNTLGISIR
jgi:phenylalanyl-tRNA synthetase beta chain